MFLVLNELKIADHKIVSMNFRYFEIILRATYENLCIAFPNFYSDKYKLYQTSVKKYS